MTPKVDLLREFEEVCSAARAPVRLEEPEAPFLGVVARVRKVAGAPTSLCPRAVP